MLGATSSQVYRMAHYTKLRYSDTEDACSPGPSGGPGPCSLSCWASLPESVFAEVLQWLLLLSGPDDVGSCVRVCRDWHRMVSAGLTALWPAQLPPVPITVAPAWQPAGNGQMLPGGHGHGAAATTALVPNQQLQQQCQQQCQHSCQAQRRAVLTARGWATFPHLTCLDLTAVRVRGRHPSPHLHDQLAGVGGLSQLRTLVVPLGLLLTCSRNTGRNTGAATSASGSCEGSSRGRSAPGTAVASCGVPVLCWPGWLPDLSHLTDLSVVSQSHHLHSLRCPAGGAPHPRASPSPTPPGGPDSHVTAEASHEASSAAGKVQLHLQAQAPTAHDPEVHEVPREIRVSDLPRLPALAALRLELPAGAVCGAELLRGAPGLLVLELCCTDTGVAMSGVPTAALLASAPGNRLQHLHLHCHSLSLDLPASLRNHTRAATGSPGAPGPGGPACGLRALTSAILTATANHTDRHLLSSFPPSAYASATAPESPPPAPAFSPEPGPGPSPGLPHCAWSGLGVAAGLAASLRSLSLGGRCLLADLLDAAALLPGVTSLCLAGCDVRPRTLAESVGGRGAGGGGGAGADAARWASAAWDQLYGASVVAPPAWRLRRLSLSGCRWLMGVPLFAANISRLLRALTPLHDLVALDLSCTSISRLPEALLVQQTRLTPHPHQHLHRHSQQTLRHQQPQPTQQQDGSSGQWPKAGKAREASGAHSGASTRYGGYGDGPPFRGPLEGVAADDDVVNAGCCGGCAALTELDLSGNMLQALPEALASALPRLTILRVADAGFGALLHPSPSSGPCTSICGSCRSATPALPTTALLALAASGGGRLAPRPYGGCPGLGFGGPGLGAGGSAGRGSRLPVLPSGLEELVLTSQCGPPPLSLCALQLSASCTPVALRRVSLSHVSLPAAMSVLPHLPALTHLTLLHVPAGVRGAVTTVPTTSGRSPGRTAEVPYSSCYGGGTRSYASGNRSSGGSGGGGGVGVGGGGGGQAVADEGCRNKPADSGSGVCSADVGLAPNLTFACILGDVPAVPHYTSASRCGSSSGVGVGGSSSSKSGGDAGSSDDSHLGGGARRSDGGGDVTPGVAARWLERLCACAPRLRYLSYSRMGVPAVPHGIAAASSLVSLDLSRNHLCGLSPSLGQLSHLEVLDLSHNQLGALPPHLTALQGLASLDVRWNVGLAPDTLTAITVAMPRLVRVRVGRHGGE